MEAYRAWRLEGGLLASLNHFNDKQPRHWRSTTEIAFCSHGCEVAACLRRSHDCGCGLYSAKTLQRVKGEYGTYDATLIYGVVFNHGVVIEGEKGYRAEKSTIVALYVADFKLRETLARNYPGVNFLMPPEWLVTIPEPQYNNNWDARYKRARAREQARKDLVEEFKKSFPGPEHEKLRVARILKGASRFQIQEWAKSYVSSGTFQEHNWIGHVENSRKAKPGDIVFEANEDTRPYVFIASTRPNRYASMRWLFDRNGIIVKRPNIRRWDEEPELLEARKKAMEEWK